jgi:hypothetical protein
MTRNPRSAAALDGRRDRDQPGAAERQHARHVLLRVASLADKLTRLAESDTDEAFVDAFAVFPSLDQMLDFAGQLIARTGRL